uniref:Nonstructural protein n=1 Tax=Dulem virus 83 TaxID=3145794 RepID=A0AAU8AW28_9VIRU
MDTFEIRMYTIRDIVAGQYSEIKLFANDNMAIRWFKLFCEKSEVARDLQLCYLGTYDLYTGEIYNTGTIIIVNGGEIIESSKA